jgi:hypothetical protein
MKPTLRTFAFANDQMRMGGKDDETDRAGVCLRIGVIRAGDAGGVAPAA